MRYFFEDFTFDTDLRELRRGDGLVAVEPQVFDLLQFLLGRRDRVVTKDDVINAVWNGRAISDSALATRINATRLAVGDSGEQQRLIRTLPRKGFRFVGEVREHGTATGHPATGAIPAQLPDKPSIAVLPFANLSADPDQEYFADGMAEEIITALARCSWLFVIARNSSFTYKGKTSDIRQIGQDLGVRYVLEGSVRRSGDRLRFHGQLIDTSTGSHIWAERFDGETSDVFALQDRFAASIVSAIEPRIQFAEIERQARKPTDHLSAYDFYLRALQQHYAFTDKSTLASLALLKEALAIEPSYALAMALSAHCYAERRNQGWAKDIETEAAEGISLATRSVELGQDDSAVLWMAAWAFWVLAQDTDRARDLANRSVLLNANSAAALSLAGWIEVASGHPERAFSQLEQARRLNPRDPRDWFTLTATAAAYLAAQRFEEAVTWARRSLLRNPRFSTTLRILSSSLAHMGQIEEAAEVLRRVFQIEPKLNLSILRARLSYMDSDIWKMLADGLRVAGMPE